MLPDPFLPVLSRTTAAASADTPAPWVLQGVTYGRLREDSDTEAAVQAGEEGGGGDHGGGGGHGDHAEFDFSEIAVHQVTAARAASV